MSSGKNTQIREKGDSINNIATGVKTDCQHAFYKELLGKAMPGESY